MGVFKNIKEGWGNYLNLSFYNRNETSPEIIEMAEERAEICRICPSLTPSGLYTIIKTILPDGNAIETLSPEKLEGDKIQGYKCGECGCGFPQNVFAPGKKCPLGKW